ncbi:hypothetical protein [Chitinophaga eiseniae]|uniref:Uncharacterized protein n=1 Tax=Chitinophaga eiseniae TaxID=634771 RepID=A0A847SUN7_9BACT|nr:hypothetical protein [Chitinophaga eiseniae]NLR81419.1 hypothetical protein [Chitinophaga eiseniae]
MRKACVLLAITGLAAIAAAAFRPVYFYKPAYEGGACTVKTVLYYSVVPDTGCLQGERVKLAKEEGECREYVVVGQ